MCQYGFNLKKNDKNSLKNPASKKRKKCSTIKKFSPNNALPPELNADLDEPQPDLDEWMNQEVWCCKNDIQQTTMFSWIFLRSEKREFVMSRWQKMLGYTE